jgi:hypothetical protein
LIIKRGDIEELRFYQILSVESFYIIKNKDIRRSELNIAYRISGGDLKHDLRNYAGIGFVILVEVILLWWLISQIITEFSSW